MTPEELIEQLRDAQPSWVKDGKGIRGTPTNVTAQRRPSLRQTNTEDHIQLGPKGQPFPPDTSTTVEATTQTTTAASGEYGFELTLESIDPTAYTIDIHVGYGEINGTPPAGMTGADDFVFTIPGADDGIEIYAEIDFTISTLAITGRSLNFAFTVPNSVLSGDSGTLYVPIGFVDIEYGTGGKIVHVFPHNRQCGDINVSFIYGAVNGAPGLFFLRQYDDPLALP